MMCIVRSCFGDTAGAAPLGFSFLSSVVFLYLNSRETTQTFCICAPRDCKLLVFCFITSNNLLSSLFLSS